MWQFKDIIIKLYWYSSYVPDHNTCAIHLKSDTHLNPSLLRTDVNRSIGRVSCLKRGRISVQMGKREIILSFCHKYVAVRCISTPKTWLETLEKSSAKVSVVHLYFVCEFGLCQTALFVPSLFGGLSQNVEIRQRANFRTTQVFLERADGYCHFGHPDESYT